MTDDKIINTNNDLSNQQTKLLEKLDFSNIPSSDEFQKIKVKPKNRWFNTIMMVLIAISGTCIGVIICTLIIHYASTK